MTKYLLTDLDDTVVYFSPPYVKFLKTEGHIELCPDTNDVLDVSNDLLHDAESIVAKFQDTEAFSNLKPLHCAYEVLPLFKRSGYTIIGISAAHNTYTSMRHRKINMQKYFPDIFDDIIHTDTKENKRKYLNRFPKSIWVEDLYENSIMGHECGHTSYYLLGDSKPIYKNDGIIQVENWFSICQKELGFLP